MEKYKKALKARIALLAAMALLAVALGIYDVFFASEAMKNSYIFGFQAGFTSALGVLAVVQIMRLRAVIRDDTKIKQQYNKENDERFKAIRAKAGLPVLLVTSIGILLAGIIAGYFNTVVFLALVIAAVCQMLVSIVIKQIYLRKM